MNCKKDFPVFTQFPELVYFDNASTTQKPLSVITSMANCLTQGASNIHRSVHRHAEEATIRFEDARELLASFIRADKNEIIFTHNCTDAINLAADLLQLTKEDQVICSIAEHHSNYLPWAQKASVIALELNDQGIIDLNQLERAFTKKTKILALSYVSNTTGNIQPVKEAISLAESKGVLTLIDAAQAIGHFPVDVGALGCDFLAFSAHKMLGPTGVGVLYGKRDLLHKLSPMRLGGGMVNHIEASKINFKGPPHGFEAGTPNIEGVIAFGKTIEYFLLHGFDTIERHLKDLESYFKNRFLGSPYVTSAFPINEQHVPIFTFVPTHGRIDLNQLGRVFSDTYQIALSVGVQCCQPLYHSFNLPGAIRASLYVYNTREEIDRFFAAVDDMKDFLR
ncbi:MAG TPA: cysteine desulfurase [Myxococcota bacterium]|nr:cysteine desulfurase [Myxococcota bacterium]